MRDFLCQMVINIIYIWITCKCASKRFVTEIPTKQFTDGLNSPFSSDCECFCRCQTRTSLWVCCGLPTFYAPWHVAQGGAQASQTCWLAADLSTESLLKVGWTGWRVSAVVVPATWNRVDSHLPVPPPPPLTPGVHKMGPLFFLCRVLFSGGSYFKETSLWTG